MSTKRQISENADAENDSDARLCDVPDCPQLGSHRAPRSRDNLTDYFWFCIDHIREYNASWNYFAGMSEPEIEAHIRADTTWRRPTWPLGANGSGSNRGDRSSFHDAFGLFEDDQNLNGRNAGREGRETGLTGNAEAEALAVLDLTPPVTQENIRTRYKELVKRLHPDANGGDRQAEDRLKLVTQAYATLKNSDTAERRVR